MPSSSLVLVDTDVVSFLFKQDSRADRYAPHLSGRTLVLSFMTVAELDRWALERNWGDHRRARLEGFLESYAGQPYHRELCRWWAAVTYEARKQGKPIQAADAWIAATALYYQIPLVTHNVADYRVLLGLQLLAGLEA